MKSTGALIGTVLGVIVSILIAWWLVNLLFGLIFFLVKLVIVAFVGILVFFALRGLLASSGTKQG